MEESRVKKYRQYRENIQNLTELPKETKAEVKFDEVQEPDIEVSGQNLETDQVLENENFDDEFMSEPKRSYGTFIEYPLLKQKIQKEKAIRIFCDIVAFLLLVGVIVLAVFAYAF